MKARISYLAIFALLPFLAQGQSSEQRSYYVVIGAFAKIDNAIRYTDKANKNNFSAQYAINPVRKLYYVYLLSAVEPKKAFAFMIKMRAETEYKDCWVFIGKLGDDATAQIEQKPLVEKPVDVKKEEKPAEVKKDSVLFETLVEPDSTEIKKHEVPKPVVKKPDGKPFYFKLVNIESGNEVLGEVHIQESNRSNQYQAFRGNEIAYLKLPANKAGTFTLVTQVPGYQQIKTVIAYNDPALTKGEEGEVIIPLELKKAKAGDYIDFNNVRFIRNSSVMNSESQNELDGLVSLMKENAKYRIKIHGHCNGKQNREIIVRGSSQKFFAMDPGANKKETMSAKVLSEERANAVKAYLVSQGIDASRVSVKAEGGKIPLYPESSTLSSYNDRVEVEVKKN